ncbi:MAG: VRR-NUC domain-containing protein, partial [Pseudolabrys sp.]
MKRRARPEQVVQRALMQHLQLRGVRNLFAFHVPNGGGRSATEGAILKGMGVVAGVPDILIIRDGKVFALELKA